MNVIKENPIDLPASQEAKASVIYSISVSVLALAVEIEGKREVISEDKVRPLDNISGLLGKDEANIDTVKGIAKRI